jgi:uncharacterized alpha-E superfamily protein
MTVTLSRAAESSYWIGRYLERASSMVRAAKSVESLGSEIVGIDPELPPRMWDEVAAVFRLMPDARKVGSDAEKRICRYVFNRDDPMTTCSSLRNARENSRAFMGAVGVTVFELLNETWHAVDAWGENPPVGLVATRAALEDLERRMFMVWGAMESSAGRGDPWRFLQAGTMLERSFRTVRVIQVKLPDICEEGIETDTPLRYARMRELLRMLSSLDAYRRVAGARLETDRIASFLVLAPQAPRGVLHCLSVVERCLESVERQGQATDPLRRVGMLVARLRFEAAESPGDSVHQSGLETLGQEISRLHASITDRFFRV